MKEGCTFSLGWSTKQKTDLKEKKSERVCLILQVRSVFKTTRHHVSFTINDVYLF